MPNLKKCVIDALELSDAIGKRNLSLQGAGVIEEKIQEFTKSCQISEFTKGVLRREVNDGIEIFNKGEGMEDIARGSWEVAKKLTLTEALLYIKKELNAKSI